MSDERLRCGEDVAPYVLGALGDEEARAFERHLAGCELCRADLEALRPVVDTLPETPEQVEPPPELRRRIMAVVEREAAERAAAERRPAARRGWAARLLPRPLPALAAACVLLVAGIGIGVAVTGDGGETLRPASAPPGVEAELRVEDDGGELVVRGMPQVPEGRVLQVWLVRGQDGAPEPTGALFTPDRDGDASVAVREDMEGVTRVMVSEEPRGGSRAPTTAPALDFRV